MYSHVFGQNSRRRREEEWSSGSVQRREEERLHDDQLLIGRLQSAGNQLYSHTKPSVFTDLSRQYSRVMQICIGFVR